VDLDTFIVAAYCTIGDELRELAKRERWRARGPRPRLADSEVLTMEVVGEYLGIDTDRGLYAYFRRHYGAWCPALRRVHRTTFVRQAANLWAVKERLWQRVIERVPHEPGFALIDSFPLPVCRFARAHRCRRFRGEAAYGKDTLVRQTFYGFRVHVRLCWPGLISRVLLAPANVSELAAVPALAEGTSGWLLGDRNYHAPGLTEELAGRGVRLLAPFRWASRDPDPSRAPLLSRFRYRIDTVFGQLVDRYRAKRGWARDSWHLRGRLLRKILSHTLAVHFTAQPSLPPLRLADLLIA
jgi:hypothetical protein